MKLFSKVVIHKKIVVPILFVGIFSYVDAMKRPFRGEDKDSILKKQKTEMQIRDGLQQKLMDLKKDEFFVFEQGTADGIVVSKNILELSQTMKHSLELVDDNEQRAIPLLYSAEAIRILFDFLMIYAQDLLKEESVLKVHSLSLCIELVNIASYLDVRVDVLECIVNHLSEMLKKIDYFTLSSNLESILATLNPDIKKQIISQWVKPCVELLGSQLMLERKEELPQNCKLGVYNSDGKVSIFKLETQNKLFLFDMTSGLSVMQRLEMPGIIASISFSSKNNRFVIGYDAFDHNSGGFVVCNLDQGKVVVIADVPMQNEILDVVEINSTGDFVATVCDYKMVLWDISDPNNVVKIELADKKYTGEDLFIAMDFCPDNKTLLTGCSGRISQDGFIEWDVSDTDKIERHEFPDNPQKDINVTSVACSSDGKMYASGAEGLKGNLLLWDKDSHVYYILQGHSSEVDRLIFAHDSKILISGSNLDQTNQFIVWDIRNVHAVRQYCLPGYSNFLPHHMSISRNKIICKYSDGKKYVIPVLRLEQLLLLDIFNDCNFLQAQVVATILQQIQAHLPVQLNDKEMIAFMTLPERIRNLMIRLFKM